VSLQDLWLPSEGPFIILVWCMLFKELLIHPSSRTTIFVLERMIVHADPWLSHGFNHVTLASENCMNKIDFARQKVDDAYWSIYVSESNDWKS
jgi:hypothetical protein